MLNFLYRNHIPQRHRHLHYVRIVVEDSFELELKLSYLKSLFVAVRILSVRFVADY